MSNLGGNSTSADTDKSNNLKGDPGDTPFINGGGTWQIGAVDTGVVAEGQDGTDGVVATVVGGSNCTVDATDPANPIVNAATQTPTTTKGDVIARGAAADERVAVGTDGQHLVADAASSAGVKWETPAGGGGDPLTTKGDLFGYDTDGNRIPVGTNDQVLTADSTAALGVAWKTPAAGGGGQIRNFNQQQTENTQAPSTSSNATKGQWVSVLTNVTIHCIGAGMRTDNNAIHHMFIAKEAATAFEVDSIIATSESTPASDIAMTASGIMYFQFAATFDLLAGEKYFFGIVRTDGSTTTSANIIFANGSRLPHPDFDADEIGLYADNANPAVGFDIGSSGTANTVPLHITYVRT